MDRFIQDVRYAVRGLRKSPAFTLVAVVTLAVGIGVNSTIFSLVNAVLLRPLPVENPEELVDVYGHTANSDDHGSNSYPNYLDYREQTQTLTGVMGYTNFFANLSIEGSSELVIGEIVTDNYFSVLGIAPTVGRAFSLDEYAAPGASPVAVISHPFWENRFGRDPGVVGRTFRMNGIVYTIVGVAPEGFGGMFPAATAQMWIPTSMVEEVEPLGNQRGSGATPGATRLERRGQHWLWLKGRVRPDSNIEAVRSELEGIAARLSAAYPATNEMERVKIIATNDVAINPDFDSTLLPAGVVLLLAVGLVLLVACANLANMLLARASTRSREVAIRLALGAGRGRLVRQMLTESLVLALAGGAVAFVLASWLARLISHFQPPLPIDIGLDFQPDWRVMVFTLLAAIVTGTVFGLVPAIRSSRPDLVPALKDTGDGQVGRRKKVELRDALVVLQVAMSLVLLVGGALMVRSLGVAREVDLGYDLDRTAYLGLALEMNGYDAERVGPFLETARIRLEQLPEVETVGMTSRLPLSLNNNGFGVFIDGHQSSATDRPYIMDGARVDEHYLDALGLELVAGRGIQPQDREERLRVAVVTETMASRHWPGENPLGREFRTAWEGEPYRIVGVVEDHKVDTPGEEAKPYLLLPMSRESSFANFIVKLSADAEPLVPMLERELRVLDPDLVFLDTGSLRELGAVRLFPIQAAAALIGTFGLLALLLAAVGLYGVIGYSVSRRVREIGIRKALGADAAKIVGSVMGRGMLLVLVGGLIGAALAVAGARALSSVLFVGSFDVFSFLSAFGVLAGVAALANWVPARRAASVDPMVVLRGE